MTAGESDLLQVNDLTVHLPTGQGVISPVAGVSFSLERGQTLALVGESGSGKSMLCRAILGLVPAQGSIRFDGRDTGRLNTQAMSRIRGRAVGVVLQNPLSSLNPVLSIGVQITETMRIHLRLSRPEARERAVSLLRSVGIADPEERLGCYPHQLSGGMRQRVAIAIALACEPKLLIADEPTTALDVTVQAEILALLDRIRRKRNMSLLLVSHDLGVVARCADSVAVMYAGRIVEQAPAAALFGGMRMPYTRALLDAVPRIGDLPQRRLPNIPDLPPDLAALPCGCRFAPRCPRAGERCGNQEPGLVCDQNTSHRYACWFPLEASR